MSLHCRARSSSIRNPVDTSTSTIVRIGSRKLSSSVCSWAILRTIGMRERFALLWTRVQFDPVLAKLITGLRLTLPYQKFRVHQLGKRNTNYVLIPARCKWEDYLS
jgi:hypothetical protein